MIDDWGYTCGLKYFIDDTKTKLQLKEKDYKYICGTSNQYEFITTYDQTFTHNSKKLSIKIIPECGDYSPYVLSYGIREFYVITENVYIYIFFYLFCSLFSVNIIKY